ncbi:bifunctional Band 7 [Babesia duncani]|uniref:Bifunctional Band 7 n=1 Tax=Babesia duncani TaxID=323732 RepID=A0AAD9UQ07_9APIC|nr:bifunctional Band 7 [Babesia duncani]
MILCRFGKYKRTIGAGMHLLMPKIDKISYIHSLKEDTIVLPNQSAITKDNASYGVEDPVFAVTQLAQTTMRSELGKLSLDTTFLERDNLNLQIVEAINAAAKNWGIACLRYEIRDITLPKNIVSAMERQAEAERMKRAEILRSEGDRQSEVNIAMGKKEIGILKAEGEAIAERQRAEAAAYALNTVTNALRVDGAMNAVALRLAERYIEAFEKLAKENNTLVLPNNASNVSDMVGQAMSLYKILQGKVSEMDVPSVAKQYLKN